MNPYITRCQVCSTEIQSKQTKFYCSDACKMRAYRKRKSQKVVLSKEEIYRIYNSIQIQSNMPFLESISKVFESVGR